MRWRAEDRRRMLAAAVDLALPTRAAQEGRRCSAMVVMVVGNCRISRFAFVTCLWQRRDEQGTDHGTDFL